MMLFAHLIGAKISCIIYFGSLNFKFSPMKALTSFPLLSLFLFCFFGSQAWAIQTKGAIVIASMEGEVSVTNNETGVALSSDRVKVGGLIFDGHTITTGPESKAVLLFSSGTITTLKADSVLNIKKFAQEKFDPKAAGKLGDRKDEPSPSETIIDLNLGDMVVDVKKLKKESSFNIDSPVGTAGIRGTVPAIQVLKMPDGGFKQNTSMLRGEIAFTPRAGGPATFLGPGQSLSIGIGANGLMLPAQLGRVDPSVMKAIEAEVEQAAAASGSGPADKDSGADAPQGATEEDAPSEEELKETDSDRQAAASGLDDNASEEALVLEKSGIIDLDDGDQVSKLDSYVEVIVEAGVKYEEKVSQRRNSAGKTDEEFVASLAGNLEDVVDVTIEAEAIGVKDEAMFDSLLEDSQNAADVKEVVQVASTIGAKDKESLESVFKNVSQADSVKEVVSVAADLGAQDKENLGSVFKNADKADDLKAVMDVAKEALGSDDGTGQKKLDSSKVSILSSTLKNADKADSMKSVMDDAKDLGAQDAENLTAVFQNADKAEDLKEVMEVAKEALGSDDGTGQKKLDSSKVSILSSTLKNADKADSMKSVMDDAKDLGAQDAENLTAVFQNADKAEDLKEVMEVAKKNLGSDDGSGSNKLDSSQKDILSSTLKNADKADKVKKIITAAQDTFKDSGSTDSVTDEGKGALTAVFRSADQAEKVAAVVDTADASASADKSKKLNSLFTVVKKVDEKKQASLATKETKDSASSALSDDDDLSEIITDITDATTAKGVDQLLEGYEASGDYSSSVLDNIRIFAEDRKEQISFENSFTNIDAVVELTETLIDLKAEKGGDADTSFDDDAVLDNLLAYADQADDLKEVVAAVADVGEDVTKLLENANEADSLLKAKEAADAVELDSAKKKAKELASSKSTEIDAAQTLAELDAIIAELDESVATAVAAEKLAKKKEVLESVAQNAEKAESVASVLEAAKDADADTKAALLRNADQAETLALAVADAESDAAEEGAGPADFGNLFSVVKQVDQKKQQAKVLESQAASTSIDQATKDGITGQSSISALKSELVRLLGNQGISSEDAASIFKAKTDANVDALLDGAGISGAAKITSKDLWVVANARREALVSEQGFQNIKTLTEIAASSTESGKSADAVLETALDNVEQVSQLATLIEGSSGDNKATLLTKLETGGDSFDFEEELESGSLQILQDNAARFGWTTESSGEITPTFSEKYMTGSTTPENIVDSYPSKAAVINYIDPAGTVGEVKYRDNSAAIGVYQLTAEQHKVLTGTSTGVAGTYKIDEVTVDDATTVTLSLSTKMLTIDEVPSFSIDIERAGDVLFVLDSPVLKDDATKDSVEMLALKAGYREKFINNISQIDNLIEISKVLGEDSAKIDVVFNNLSLLDSLTPLTQTLRNKPEQLQFVYTELSSVSSRQAEVLTSANDLAAEFINQPVRLEKLFEEENFANIELIDELVLGDGGFKGNNEQVSLLFNNLDKVTELSRVADQFVGDTRTDILKKMKELSFTYRSDADKRNIIFANPEQISALHDLLTRSYISADLDRVDIVFANAYRADAFLAVLDDLRGENGTGSFQILFTDTENTLQNQGLAKLKSEYDSKYHAFFDIYVDQAAEIAATASKFKDNPDRLDIVFNNIDKIADINKFANEFAGDEPRLSIFFSLIDDLSNLKEFKTIAFENGIAGGVALDIYNSEAGFLELGRLDGEFLGDLYDTGVSLYIIPLKLAQELQKLSLTKDELKVVVEDLVTGDTPTAPSTNAPGGTQTDTPEFKTLSFLLDHDFNATSNISAGLVVASEHAFASSFFEEVLDIYQAFTEGENNPTNFTPSDSQIHDNLTQALASRNENQSNSQSTTTTGDDTLGVLGGRKLSFGAGEYDLSQLSYQSILVGATEEISLKGHITFNPKVISPGAGGDGITGTADDINTKTELLMLSAGGISFFADEIQSSYGTSVRYNGDSLGFGSLDSMDIIDVDLYAKSEISARSLDSLVIKNSRMETSGGAADIVRLLAHEQLTVDNLAFHNTIKEIHMQANTLNLYHLNFPDGSMVKLNSLYGGVDGKYPNFNSSVYGRVNFVKNIQYSSNLIMDRSSFDQYGTNVTIGQLGQ